MDRAERPGRDGRRGDADFLDSPTGRPGRTTRYSIRGRHDVARRRYEHSLLLKADLQIAHKELADILCGEGEYDLAITHYEAALRIQPDFKEAKQNLLFTRTLAGH